MNAWSMEMEMLPSPRAASTASVHDDAMDAMDSAALLDALVFMDDLDLDSELLAPAPAVELEVVASIDRGLALLDAQTSGSPAAPPPCAPSSPPASTSSSTSPPASPSVSEAASSTGSRNGGKTKGVVNRSRNRRREELAYLRNMVGELEERLSTMRLRAEEQQQHEQKKLTGEDAPADDPVLTAVWEDLAARQYAQRQRAETENAKLRRMLEDQIQVGKSLERLLKKRTNVEDVDLQLAGKRQRRSSIAIAWNKAVIYDELLAQMPSLYRETEPIYRGLCFDRNTPNFRDIQVRNDPHIGMMVEVTEAHVFPFEYELTAHYYWTLFLSLSENDQFHYHDAELEDDVLKVQFGMTVQVARTRGELNIKIVSQRFVEDGRTVIVWVAFLDPTEICETNMDGIYMRHKGWTIIEPLVPSASSGSQPSATVGTRTTAYSFAVPEAFEDVPDQKRKVGTLTNFMLTIADVQINERMQVLENRLVEVSRGR